MSLLNKAISNYNNSNEKLFISANIILIYGEFERAIDDSNNYLLAFPDDPDAINNRGLSKILLPKDQEGYRDLEFSFEYGNYPERKSLFNAFCNSNHQQML